MKRTGWIFLLVVLIFPSCSVIKPKTEPYPQGIVFPVVKDNQTVFKGEIIRAIKRKDDRLYFSSYDGKVLCVDAVEGKTLWTFQSPVPLDREPFLGDGRVYVIGDQKTVTALNSEGHSVWSYESSQPVTTTIFEHQNRVFLGTEEGLLMALESSSGDEAWRFRAGGAVRSNFVLIEDLIAFGCDDGRVYFMDQKGMPRGAYQTSRPVGQSLSVEGSRIYFATDQPRLFCYDLKKQKVVWKIGINGVVNIPPIVHDTHLFVLTWNGVLYCLDKRRGDIEWWRNVPSRSSYSPETAGEKILVSSLSNRLVCFDAETGENTGYYLAGGEIRSNPVWNGSRVIISLYAKNENKGWLAFLKKVVKADLSPSKQSPWRPNEEIIFTAEPVGFFQPEFEFYTVKEDKKEIVQDKSEERVWSWFPPEEGEYRIGVRVTDERETVEVELPYRIIRIEKVMKGIQGVLPRISLWLY